MSASEEAALFSVVVIGMYKFLKSQGAIYEDGAIHCPKLWGERNPQTPETAVVSLMGSLLRTAYEMPEVVEGRKYDGYSS